MATKEEILGQSDLAFVEVALPEWGGMVVRLKEMSGAVRDAFETSVHLEREAAKAERRNVRDVRARKAVYSIVDDAGAFLFTEADIPALSAKSGKALDRIWDAAEKLNKLTAAEIEEVKKN